jgi:hypothetical protein
MKTIVALMVLMALIVPGIAMDQRDGSNGVPFLAPDPSLKTTDRFLANMGGQYIGEVSQAYQLPPIFGGPMPATESDDPAWMNLTAHNQKLNNEGKLYIGSAYDMTEEQLGRAGIELGKEAWL